MASSESIPWAESRNEFPVLVRVRAPLERTHRHSVDLVAVLDTSGSMGWYGRLDSVKEAMGFVIDNLGNDDRLSIVPFRHTQNDHLRCPLSEMSQENRTKLKTIVNSLQAKGGDDLESANEAAKILGDRTPDDISSRIGRIIYLSDGTYDSGSYRQSISADKQVGTIEINDLYAGEKKNFIVFLSIPEGKDKLITISGLYRNVKISKNDAIQFGKREVVVKRPKASTPSSEVVRPEVAAELVRGKLVKVVSSMATEPQLNNSNLQSLWDGIRNSENGLEAPEKIISNLDKVLLLMLYVRIPDTNPPGMIIVKVNKDDTTSPTDASRHPGWPKMEKSLEVTMLRSMEDFGIASVFHGTSLEEVRDATNKYLYLAIVHASILGSRFRSEDVGTISMLEEKVKSLEAQKNALLVKIEALAKEKEEMALSAQNCPAVKESDEALQRANTRIVELEKQLRDKKAFAENVMSELNNAEDHLKTCGQRVDMLEAKVREMEGVVIIN
ncbi:hypothetical protein QYE76_058238 [Lolium multiflorum]|uniref:VWFA domain-containing protein n=1 Tax=Lolium multiflorum TaxID=4521 RepID=A0AAD8T683_LOLMU|nr:hypothetical protein QYE76_058238 [Lolium multiflorum]